MEILEKIRRVLLVSSKPDRQEFLQSLKITGIGFLAIGLVGFAVFLIVQLSTGGAGI